MSCINISTMNIKSLDQIDKSLKAKIYHQATILDNRYMDILWFKEQIKLSNKKVADTLSMKKNEVSYSLKRAKELISAVIYNNLHDKSYYDDMMNTRIYNAILETYCVNIADLTQYKNKIMDDASQYWKDYTSTDEYILEMENHIDKIIQKYRNLTNCKN